jgi:5-formyltetrahydrofolate cyclo-ligase
MTDRLDGAKQTVRERMWAELDAAGAAAPGVHGTIPAFAGAEAAAARLASLPIWREARVIKAVPDRAQLPVRVRALDAGKTVYMAIPRMADLRPFYLLDPSRLSRPFERSATGRGAADVAPRVGPEEIPPIDLVVCGSVAVDRRGVRVGKGAGYSDLEVALLQEAGVLTAETTIVTTVHSLQVVDGDLPEADHDVRVDLIVTPDDVIPCGPRRRPAGIIWAHLDEDKIASIPALAAAAGRRRR